MKKIVNHLWIKKENNQYHIGMTPELIEEAGDISYLHFNESEIINVDDSIVELEASKAVLEIVSPLAGKVVTYNQEAEENPSQLNDPSSDHWLLTLTDVDEAAYRQL